MPDIPEKNIDIPETVCYSRKNISDTEREGS